MWKPDVFALWGHPGTKVVLPQGKATPAHLERADTSGDGRASGGGSSSKSAVASSPSSSSSSSSSSPNGGEASGVVGGGEGVLVGSEGATVAAPGSAVVLREFEFKDADIWFVRFALDPTLQVT